MIVYYAERAGPGLLAEPLNAASNLAFFVAAWAGWRLARRRHALDAGIGALLALLLAIGVGSTLFHTFASEWSRWLDVIPILLFQLLYLWLYARRNLAGGAGAALLALVGFFLVSMLAGLLTALPDSLRMYGGAWLLLFACGIHRGVRPGPERGVLLLAAGVFSLSLFCRAVDLAPWVRAHLPRGTHFLWHVLNGVTLYLSVRALVASATRIDRRGR